MKLRMSKVIALLFLFMHLTCLVACQFGFPPERTPPPESSQGLTQNSGSQAEPSNGNDTHTSGAQEPSPSPSPSPSTSGDSPEDTGATTTESPGVPSDPGKASPDKPGESDKPPADSPKPSESPSPAPSPSPTSSPTSSPSPSPSVQVTRIVVGVSSRNVSRGDTIEPTVTIYPSNATDRSYTLSSSNENILRYSGGRWTAVGGGTAELIATASNGVTGSAVINVVVPAEGIALGADSISMFRGESITLRPAISPADATDRRIHYTSGNESVARVSADGTIRAVGDGTTEIRGTVGGYYDTCIVTVTTPVVSISISLDRRAFQVGEAGSFSVRVEPYDATDRSFTISLSGAAIALTGENTFTCVSGGTVTITATASNGVSGSQTISIIDLISLANEVFRLTNIERANHGLPALSSSPVLTQVAVLRANESIRHFSHDRPDGRSCFTAFTEAGASYRFASENLGKGQTTPAEVVAAWMDSPGHRENILKAEFGQLGTGVAIDSSGTLYWSQSFTD